MGQIQSALVDITVSGDSLPMAASLAVLLCLYRQFSIALFQQWLVNTGGVDLTPETLHHAPPCAKCGAQKLIAGGRLKTINSFNHMFEKHYQTA